MWPLNKPAIGPTGPKSISLSFSLSVALFHSVALLSISASLSFRALSLMLCRRTPTGFLFLSRSITSAHSAVFSPNFPTSPSYLPFFFPDLFSPPSLGWSDCSILFGWTPKEPLGPGMKKSKRSFNLMEAWHQHSDNFKVAATHIDLIWWSSDEKTGWQCLVGQITTTEVEKNEL